MTQGKLETVLAASSPPGAEAGLSADALVNALTTAGVTSLIGVPCSFFGAVISKLQSGGRIEYLTAANEGEAVAIAVGERLGGTTSAVLMQNSGLGNAVNPLTSLSHTLRVPVLMFISWRGEPGRPDEPQHEVMGEITPDLLTLMHIDHEILPKDPSRCAERVQQAVLTMEQTGRPYAFIVPKGTLDSDRSPASEVLPQQPLTRAEVLDVVLEQIPHGNPLVATTGYTARELAYLDDRASNLYIVGSMGCASSVALGVARSTPNRRVVVIDGDGAALMRLEAIATIGRTGAPNFVHLLLDNGVYESTGHQPTGSSGVDLAAVAKACGYREACTIDTAEEVRAFLASQSAGPRLARIMIRPGSPKNLARPRLSPPLSAQRFADALKEPKP